MYIHGSLFRIIGGIRNKFQKSQADIGKPEEASVEGYWKDFHN
jgi:hypothetical protein